MKKRYTLMNDHPSGAYYGQKLAAERLLRCYELATPRVRRYLEAEVAFLRGLIPPRGTVLELGCGYGRVLRAIGHDGRRIVGVDTAVGSLEMGVGYTAGVPGCALVAADASVLPFGDGLFDSVVCVQNGMSAFGVDRPGLVREAMRVAVTDGRAIFSSYSERFWDDRLEWFCIQSAHGLVGEIDEAQTGDGVIVCRDGFRAETIGAGEFEAIGRELGLETTITECDASSLFCVYRNLC